jgi:hypothetical protein
MGRYLELSDTRITRPQAEQRMFAKLAAFLPMWFRFSPPISRSNLTLPPADGPSRVPKIIEEFELQDLIQ